MTSISFGFQQNKLLQGHGKIRYKNKADKLSQDQGKSENQTLTLAEIATSLVGTSVLKSPANEAPLAKNGTTLPPSTDQILFTLLILCPVSCAYSLAFFLAASYAAFLACLTPKVLSDWSKVTPLTRMPSILLAASMSLPIAAPSAVISLTLTVKV